MDWSGSQIDALHQALLSAYPTQPKLQRMLRIEMDLRLNHYAGGANYGETVYELIEALEGESRLDELVAAAQRQNPRNLKLKQLTKAPTPVTQGPEFTWRGPTEDQELQGLLQRRQVDSYDVAFLQGMAAPARAVCRIELPNERADRAGFSAYQLPCDCSRARG